MRARELGIEVGTGRPGPLNAITDVAGVRVGHATIVEGADVRTGVTMVFPHEGEPGLDPVFAGCHRLNGNGELTGLEWVRESGLLTSPIGLTNTHSVGVVRDAIIADGHRRAGDAATWSLPVVGETWDGIAQRHQRLPREARARVRGDRRRASDGPVAEGNVGGGHRHDLPRVQGRHRHGVARARRSARRLHGRRARAGEPRRPGSALDRRRPGRARRSAPDRMPVPPRRVRGAPGAGSIIIVVATDAPLLPHQCERARAARRRSASRAPAERGENGSGDIFIAFSTGNRGLAGKRRAPRDDARQRVDRPALLGRRSRRPRRRSSTRCSRPRR